MSFVCLIEDEQEQVSEQEGEESGTHPSGIRLVSYDIPGIYLHAKS